MLLELGGSALRPCRQQTCYAAESENPTARAQ